MGETELCSRRCPLSFWVWVGVPFPTRTHDERHGGVGGGIDQGDGGEGIKIIEPSFAFFLFFYYGKRQFSLHVPLYPSLMQRCRIRNFTGIYLSAALLFITKLFDLYRLNWWPRSLGGLTCYVFFWATSLAVGFGCHWADIFGIGRRRARWDEGGGGGSGEDDEVDWERKSEYDHLYGPLSTQMQLTGGCSTLPLARL
jgi:hypothetical protein